MFAARSTALEGVRTQVLSDPYLLRTILSYADADTMLQMRKVNLSYSRLIRIDPESHHLELPPVTDIIDSREVSRALTALIKLAKASKLDSRAFAATYLEHEAQLAALPHAKIKKVLAHFRADALPFVAILAPGWRVPAEALFEAHQKWYKNGLYALLALGLACVAGFVIANTRDDLDSGLQAMINSELAISLLGLIYTAFVWGVKFAAMHTAKHEAQSLGTPALIFNYEAERLLIGTTEAEDAYYQAMASSGGY